VIEACDPEGLVRVRGEMWKAATDPAEPLAVGERAVVFEVEGLKVRVAKEQR